MCFAASVNDITTPSVSLEGKSLWILRSLPVTTRQILRDKHSLQLLLPLPGLLFAGVCGAVVLGGAQSPTISDNCADILLAFEPMEAVRALSKANADTIVITNTAPVVPFIPGGSAAYPSVDDLLACLRAKVGRVIAFDARKESLEAGNPLGLNMVMLGALYGAADMPLTKESQMEAIRKNGKPAFVESNLNCFERGFKAASEETAKG